MFRSLNFGLCGIARRQFSDKASLMKGVKELRGLTGAGLNDCRAAWIAAEGAQEEALNWLEKKGIAKADKKRSRITGAGVVSATHSNSGSAIFELNSETDFVAKTDCFKSLLNDIQENCPTQSDNLLKSLNDIDGLQNTLTTAISTTGENIRIRRAFWMPKSEHGVIGLYIHNRISGTYDSGALLSAVSLTPEVEPRDPDAFLAVANSLAQHIVASSDEDIPLLEQKFMQQEKTVGGWLKAKGKQVGCRKITVCRLKT